MNDFYYIPPNFEDSGKILGLFNLRNVIEAGAVSLPLLFLAFQLTPGGLTWKIIVAATLMVPAGGFALLGINDDPLTVFVQNWWRWLKNRRIMEYRGEVK